MLPPTPITANETENIYSLRPNLHVVMIQYQLNCSKVVEITSVPSLSYTQTLCNDSIQHPFRGTTWNQKIPVNANSTIYLYITNLVCS
jgi:hypothetical protein